MNWSFSAARTFSQCPRKWFFREFYADGGSDDDARKEAYFLNELSSVPAWRGKLIDQVITRFIVPRINAGESIGEQEAVQYGHELSRRQLKFGQSRYYRKDATSEFRSGPDYCAFYELEYGTPLSSQAIQQSFDIVETSLRNLMRSELLSRIMEDGIHLVAQRTLKFKFADVLVNCTPDLVAFFKSSMSLVVDWKVERLTYKDHWMQLAMYGFALSQIKPHKDFPVECHDSLKDPRNIDLLEFQLLHNLSHGYKITEDDLVDIQNFVYSSASQMLRFSNGTNGSDLDPFSLPATSYPGACMRCNFRKLCWRNAE